MADRSRSLGPTSFVRFLILAVENLAGRLGGRYARTEGAHVLVRDGDGRILVVKPIYLPGDWLLPGGRVERDERPHLAAIRETREETGLEVELTGRLLIDARRRELSFVFEGTVAGGTLAAQSGEIAVATWLRREEIARSAPRLERLLRIVDRAGPGVAYVTDEADA